MKTALVLGAGGMIGHKAVSKLVSEGFFVRGVDLKYPEYSKSEAHEFFILDLRNDANVDKSMTLPVGTFDEVYMYAAEMGGAEYIFTKQNDADIILNSAIMNLNVARIAVSKGIKKILFSSSACVYSEKLQESLNSPALKEDTVWQGKPDSIYGIEKLFSEDVYDSFRRNKGLNVRICRFHNIFTPECTYKGGREKAPAAVSRKVAEAIDGGDIEIFGDGLQQRSFLYIDEALEGVRRLMDSDYLYPLNIGSDEMISINDLAKMVIGISGKNLSIKNVHSDALGVRGRNSDNGLIQKELGWRPTQPLRVGMEKLYSWVNQQVSGGI